MNAAKDTNQMAVPVVIPAYQPGRGLVSYVKKLADEDLGPIYIVNDGSEGSYDAIFSELERISSCRLIRHHTNMGKGRALKSAFSIILASENNAAGCVTVDSDGQHSVADVRKCVKEFLSDPRCLVMGVRDFSDKGIPPRNRYGNLFLKWMYRRFADMDLKDTQTGLRVYPKEYMKLCLDVPGERFDFENRALLVSKDDRVPILQVPIETIYFDRNEYVSHYSPIKDSLIAYGIVLGSYFKHKLFKVKKSSDTMRKKKTYLDRMEHLSKEKKFAPNFFLYDIARVIFFIWRILWLRPIVLYENGNARKRVTGGAVLISNHQSYKDPLYISSSILPYRRIRYVGLHTFLEDFPVRIPLSKSLMIPLDRDNPKMQSIIEIINNLKDGWIIGVFPEGHVNWDSQLSEFKDGAALFSNISGCPVIPTYILKRRSVFEPLICAVGEPVLLKKEERGANKIEDNKILTNVLMKKEKELEKRCREYYEAKVRRTRCAAEGNGQQT